MDMAGFAINLNSFLSKPDIKMGFKEEKGHKRPVKDGHLETDFLENFATRESVECRGSDKEVCTQFPSVCSFQVLPTVGVNLAMNKPCSCYFTTQLRGLS